MENRPEQEALAAVRLSRANADARGTSPQAELDGLVISPAHGCSLPALHVLFVGGFVSQTTVLKRLEAEVHINSAQTVDLQLRARMVQALLEIVGGAKEESTQ